MKKRGKKIKINISAVKKCAALVFSVLLTVGGGVLGALSVRDRVLDLEVADEFDGESFYFATAPEKVDSKYLGYGIVIHGDLTYEGNGADDPLFGVGADSAVLFRISEMYQWIKDGSDYKKAWSSELVDTGDDTHANPDKYPLDSGSSPIPAHNVRLGGYKVSDGLLPQLTSREKLSSLPDVDVEGFHTDGEYITNSRDPSSPEIGDVRVRYEYATAKEVTLCGMQFESAIAEWTSDITDSEYFRSFEGNLDKEGVLRAYRREAASPIWLMLIPGVIVMTGGAVLIVLSFIYATGYKPTLKLSSGKKGAKKRSFEGRTAALIYGMILGVLTSAVVVSAMWIRVAPLFLLACVVIAVVFMFFFVTDIVSNTPRRQKQEEEYVPILKHHDGDGRRR